MGVQVGFNYAQWVAMFPEFAAVREGTAQGYFTLATTFCRNDGGGPVPTQELQSTLLNTLTAHVAQLFWTPPGAQPNQLTGRITDATEGSVSVSTELMSTITANQAWFMQTKYGVMYWQMTAPFRTMRYTIANPNFVDPWVRPGGFGL